MNEPVSDPVDTEIPVADDGAEELEATAEAPQQPADATFEPAQDGGDPDAMDGEADGEPAEDGAAPDGTAEEATAAPNIRLLNDEDEPSEDAGSSHSPSLRTRLPLSASDWQQAQRWAGANARTLTVVGVVAVVLFWSWMTWSLVGSVAAIDRSVEALTAEVAGQTAGVAPLAAVPVAAAAETPAAAEPDVAAAVAAEATPDAVATPEPTPTAVATPPPPARLFGKLVVTNGDDLWNCSDFGTWEQAKRVYDANLPNDPNLIDFDRNGVPCESLLPN